MIIFFDIDGVLNKKSQWTKMYSLDAGCIAHFASLVNKTKAKIVISSSWRTGFKAAHDSENSGPIRDLEKELDRFGISIYDKTPILRGRKRDIEIERWLYFNPTEKYLILDDDESEYGTITEKNYFVDCKTGITERDVKLCSRRVR